MSYGVNMLEWLCYVEVSLNFADASQNKECFPLELWNQWERENAIALSWLMNSISSILLGCVVFISTAQAVWQDLKERFNKINGSGHLIFNKKQLL